MNKLEIEMVKWINNLKCYKIKKLLLLNHSYQNLIISSPVQHCLPLGMPELLNRWNKLKAWPCQPSARFILCYMATGINRYQWQVGTTEHWRPVLVRKWTSLFFQTSKMHPLFIEASQVDLWKILPRNQFFPLYDRYLFLIQNEIIYKIPLIRPPF